MSRKKIVAGAIGALSAALVASVMFASGTSATETGTSSAFGIKAEGLLNIDATPSVSGTDEKSLADVDLPGGLGHADVLRAAAGYGKAEARVAGLQVNGAAGLPALTAKVIEAKCTSDGHGSSALVNAKIGDHPLKVDVPANTGIDLGAVSVMLNKQTKHADGSVNVTAVSVKVQGVVALEIASVHCGPGGTVVTPEPTCPTSCPSLPAAPPAKTVKGHVAVTG